MAKIAVQLYTLRQECHRDILGTLEQVADVGYRGVEWFGSRFGVPLEAIQDRLLSLGLEVVAAHVPLEDLENRAGEVTERTLALGASHLVCPWLNDERRSGEAVYERLGAFLDRLGGELRELGVGLSYHNHDFELREVEPDGLERLARASAAAHLGFELDVYWLAYAGADPAECIRRYADRVHLIHLKDGLLDRPVFRPLGRGEVELGPVLEAAGAGDVEALIVEQDECDSSPFVAIAESLVTLRRWLAGGSTESR